MMRAAWRGLRISSKILFGAILFAIISGVFIGGLTVYVARMLAENTAFESSRRLCAATEKLIAVSVEQVDRIISAFYADYYGVGYDELFSEKPFDGPEEALRFNRSLEKFFQQVMILNKDFTRIYFYISDEKQYDFTVGSYDGGELAPRESRWYKAAMAAGGRTIIFSPHASPKTGKDAVITFVRAFIVDSKPVAVLMTDVSIDSVKSLIAPFLLHPDARVVIRGNNGLYVARRDTPYDTRFAASYERLSDALRSAQIVAVDGEDYLSVHSAMASTGWEVSTLTPMSYVNANNGRLILFSIASVIVTIALLVPLSRRYSLLLSRPIEELERGISRLSKGDFDINLTVDSEDELGSLTRQFNDMAHTIRTLKISVLDEQLLRKDAELAYLQSQVNPHFLYNTLQVISSIAIVRKVPEIQDIARALSSMMRYNLGASTHLVPLRMELDNINSYLTIQRFRYEDRFTWSAYVADGAYDASVINFLLQPLVENSFIHGFEKVRRTCKLELAVDLEGGMLLIALKDNGKGFEPERLDEVRAAIRASQDSPAFTQSSHIGLGNIARRLRDLYDDAASVEIDSVPNGETTVRISLPATRGAPA